MEIQAYRFGRIEIDGQVYTNDVKIVGTRVAPEWWRKQGHYVDLDDVVDLLDAEADICIFGTGAYGSMRISPSVKEALEKKGVETILEKTASACNRFNALRKKGKRVIAGFHLTC
jgi:hypothetical protein